MIKKILTLILLGLCSPLAAQMRDGTYQSQKTGRENTVETITVNVIPLGNGVMHFHESDPRKPLTGRFRITVNRREYYTGSLQKGIAHGDWERHYNDRLLEKSSYKNGLPDGQSIRYRDSGAEEYVYTYRDGIRQHYIAYHSGGGVEEERFYDEDGRLHGEMFTRGEGGGIEGEKRYRHGQRHGKQVETNRDGFKTEQEYVDGQPQGEYARFYPNGQLCEKGTYDENGEKSGKWRVWNEDGRLSREEHYLNGALNGEKRTYYAGEKLKSTEVYAAGKRHGPMVEYDETPHRISREATYAEGQLHGPFQVWHDGILWREGTYQDGELIHEKEFAAGKLQIVKLLDENGALIPVERYDNTGRRTYKNTNYRRHSSVTLKESAGGVLDVEIH